MRSTDNTATFVFRFSRNSGSLNLLEPEEPGQACKSIALPSDICNFWRQLRVLAACSRWGYEIRLEGVSYIYIYMYISFYEIAFMCQLHTNIGRVLIFEGVTVSLTRWKCLHLWITGGSGLLNWVIIEFQYLRFSQTVLRGLKGNVQNNEFFLQPLAIQTSYIRLVAV